LFDHYLILGGGGGGGGRGRGRGGGCGMRRRQLGRWRRRGLADGEAVSSIFAKTVIDTTMTNFFNIMGARLPLGL
jgi:hypothetical protein